MESTQRKLPVNPGENANFFSKIVFAWTIPFFKIGYRKIISLNDVFQPLTSDKSESLGDRLEE